MNHSKNVEPDFVFSCVRYGVSEPLSWKLFDYIQSREGLISEYEVRLYLGIGEQRAQSFISELVQNQYATEDIEYDGRGVTYVDERAGEDIDLLAEIELGMRKPLWNEQQ